jgi:hypothetical protein
MTADLMTRLGARSRFQAGALAAQQGWLMAGAAEAASTGPASPVASGEPSSLLADPR